MNKKIFSLVHEQARKNAIIAVSSAPDGYIVEVKEPARTVSQNAFLWACLNDISHQVIWHGMKLKSEDWKHIFTAALKGQRSAPGINGGFVVLGQSTSKMRVSEFSDLLELINSFGAERGVKWSEESKQAMEWAARWGK